jgi:hypothetical protein
VPKENGMAAEAFFARWSKKSAETRSTTENESLGTTQPESNSPAAAVVKEEKTLPTLEDVAQLTPEADFSAFMASGVEETVKRAAMKKLFSDPHFNVMDGLDVYIDDYNSFEPLTPDVLAALNHAKDLLNPLQSSGPSMQLLDALDEEVDACEQPKPGEQDIVGSETVAQTETDAPEDAPPSAAKDRTQTDNPSGSRPTSDSD